ncbi:MAG: hypothetical protein AB8G77_28720 [Rhodothermales bacterium]
MQHPTIPDTPWQVVFHDGSNNGFRFRQASLEEEVYFVYDPIAPAESSSGTYSGGEPNEGVLTSGQLEELWMRIYELKPATTADRQQRVMGSGAFRLTAPDGSLSFIVPNGMKLREFSTFIMQFRKE